MTSSEAIASDAKMGTIRKEAHTMLWYQAKKRNTSPYICLSMSNEQEHNSAFNAPANINVQHAKLQDLSLSAARRLYNPHSALHFVIHILMLNFSMSFR